MNFLQHFLRRPRVLMVLAAFWSFGCLSLATSFSFIGTYPVKATMVSVDNFANFYTAGDNKLYKFSEDGAFLYPYESYSHGKIGMVDVSNPLKILVFYPDFLQAITLDKYLTQLTTYNFFALGYQNISAVATSTDDYLWFYDNTDFMLKKIDETGTIFQQSEPLNVILNAVPNPNFMVEKDNVMYVNDTALGVLVFDGYGNYEKTLPLRGLDKFQVFQDQVIYFQNNKLNSYNMITLDFKTLGLPDSTDVLTVALQKDRLAVLKKDKIDFYKY